MSTLNTLLQEIKSHPENISFSQVISTIDENFQFTPTTFKNGELTNAPNENNGSCKILAFAKNNDLSVEQTLHLFGDYYRKDVLEHPDATDHQNIRNFSKHGWEGVSFNGKALEEK